MTTQPMGEAMTEQNNGGAAFPGTVWTPHGHKAGESMGMSLRDWFAGQALAGLGGCCDSTGMWMFTPENAAWTAYGIADAMLKAREASHDL